MKQRLNGCLVALVVAFGLAGHAQEPKPERILIRAPKPYTEVESHVRAVGGQITHRLKYIDLVAAEIPAVNLNALKARVGADAVFRDLEIPVPSPIDPFEGLRRFPTSGDDKRLHARSVDAIEESNLTSFASVHPTAYLINNTQIHINALHAAGFLGQGVVVGVLDSGIRPGFPHISLDHSVIGCEDFFGDGLGCENFANDGHGTFVAGMISANVVFTLDTSDPLRNAVLMYCPQCFIDPPTYTQLPMLASAPRSSIYAFRWIGPHFGTASAILAGMDRAIELKKKFDGGDPDGVNIQVLNMSLAVGATLFTAHSIIEQMVDAVLDANIVPVVAAGNDGPSGVTIATPGTAYSALSVGASEDATHFRILNEIVYGPFFGPHAGQLLRPSDTTKTAVFSSRGPVADGQRDPNVVANGMANIGQGYGPTVDTISFGGGTSFSTGSVSGVAAVLWQAFPHATARQIRNAIIMSANPSLIQDGSGPADRGRGMVDAESAYNLLRHGHVPDTSPGPPKGLTASVAENIEHATGQEVHDGPVVHQHVDLKPGQRAEIFYEVKPHTKRLTIDVSRVAPSLPPEQQNQLFGDSLFFTVHDSTTGFIPSVFPGYGYLVSETTLGGRYVIDNPDTGVMRMTSRGTAWNAGDVSADVRVVADFEPVPEPSVTGRVMQDDLLVYSLNIPSGVKQADFRLSWEHDWGRYPTNDVDLWLLSPSNSYNFDAATLHTPERATVSNPTPGTWTLFVNGYEMPTKSDKFRLSVVLDGKVVRIR